MTMQPDLPLIPSFKAFSRAVSAAVILVGCVVLVGWLLNISPLKSVFPGLATMKANTALAFVLAGMSLRILCSEQTDHRLRRLAQTGAGMVALLGLLTLSQDLFGWDLGLDQLLFKETAPKVAMVPPGRMAPSTAFNFILLGCALLLLDVKKRAAWIAGQVFTLAAGIIVLLALIGYIYNIQSLYSVGPFSSMALHTALTFQGLTVAMLCARPDRGVMRLITNNTTGGAVARRLLPAVIGVPILLGWLRLNGQRVGLYGTEFGIALFALSNIIIFTFLIGWNASLLDRTEIKRKQAETALRESQDRLAGIVNSATDAIITVDAEQRIMLFNTAAEQMFHCAATQAIGQPFDQFIPERFRLSHQEHIRVFDQTGITSRTMGAPGAVWGLRANGEEFPLEASISQVEVAGQKFYTVILRDITERKRAEVKLKQTLTELARSNTELQQFAYVASHDLQEPLRMVASYTQLLARRYQGRLDADADEFIAFAVDGASRMQRLINDLLAYSRVDTRGKAPEPTDAGAALAEALANLKAAVAESEAVVTHDPLPTIPADETQLVQLFQNLVGNALKFRSAQPPCVHVSATQQGKEWVFSVQDNGIGLEPQYAERIFVIFHRLHSQGDYPGTGIGLAICKRIAERHGGRIWLESQPGQGATFYFSLPKDGVKRYE